MRDRQSPDRITAKLAVLVGVLCLLGAGLWLGSSSGPEPSKARRPAAETNHLATSAPDEGAMVFAKPAQPSHSDSGEPTATLPRDRPRRDILNAPLLPYSAPPEPNTPTFRVSWKNKGLCEDTEPAREARQVIEEKFGQQQVGTALFYIEPALGQVLESDLEFVVERAHDAVARNLGLPPTPVTTYIYKNPKLLRTANCVPDHVVAFYDGAIHLVVEDRILVRSQGAMSFTHEYVHHALYSAGIYTPMWLHEGAALVINQENWWEKESYLTALLTEPLPLEWMVNAFAYSSPQDLATRVYTQAASMARMVLDHGQGDFRPAPGAPPNRLAQVVDDLRTGKTDAQRAFSHSLGKRPFAAWRAWQEYVRTKVKKGRPKGRPDTLNRSDLLSGE